jgi:pyruvate kinase
VVSARAIVTVPPYAPFTAEVAAHPCVCGLRLNTVMPLADPIETVLERLAGHDVPLWVDLKARQLRVVEPAVPPYTALRVSHRLRVSTPVDAWLSDGRERVRVEAVDGDRLVLGAGARRLVGPGESVNIIDPSLEIEGLLTELDREYLEAMGRLGLRRVMLSYVESPADLTEVRSVLPDAEILAKVETERGVRAARDGLLDGVSLVAARGDLYVEVLRPHRVVSAVAAIIAADPGAAVASRLLESLERHPVPSCADIGDLAWLLRLGYRTFVLGDRVCLERDTVLEALNLLEAVAAELV